MVKRELSRDNKELIIGGHMSIVKGYTAMIERLLSVNGRAVQCFFKSYISLKERNKYLDVNDPDIINARKLIEKHKIVLCSHAQYAINLVRPYDARRKLEMESLLNDIENNYKLGGIGTVLHLGSNVNNYPRKKALEILTGNLKRVISQMKKMDKNRDPKFPKLIIENQALAGNNIATKVDDMVDIYHNLTKDEQHYIGFCIDTCHFYVSGYEMSNAKFVRKLFDEIIDRIGYKKIMCIHFNDARTRTRDAHEDLFYGYIGYEKLGGNPECLIEVAELAKKDGIALILETPARFNSYENQIKTIKELVNKPKDKTRILKEYYKSGNALE